MDETHCAHCGRVCRDFEGGYASVQGKAVCHPNALYRPDCYHLITVYHEPMGHRLTMGMSCDAVLAYGIDLGDIGLLDSYEIGEALAASPETQGLTLEWYNTDSHPKYVLVVESSVLRVYRGETKELAVPGPIPRDDLVSAGIRMLKESYFLSIPEETVPRWLLFSWYSN